MFISTDAIILKNTPYKETSIISRLFSKEQGKISVIFKGAKRNNKSIAAVIEPGNIVNITYYNKSTIKVAKEITGCNLGETSKDNKFTLVEVECLGACCNAPVVQINDDYYEDLDEDSFRQLILKLKNNQNVNPGSQIGRQSSEPKKN